MKNQVLKLLRQEEGFVSGQELCERFQVSRTAVWKMIHQLKEEGYEIEAVKNRGYHLVSVPDLVTEPEILSCLHTRFMGQNCVYFAETDSTNTQIRRLAEEEPWLWQIFRLPERAGGEGVGPPEPGRIFL